VAPLGEGDGERLPEPLDALLGNRRKDLAVAAVDELDDAQHFAVVGAVEKNGRQVGVFAAGDHLSGTRCPIDGAEDAAPASGWIDRASLRYEPGVGILGAIDWTPRAAQMIAGGEFADLKAARAAISRG
jgi:hypothetical protein